MQSYPAPPGLGVAGRFFAGSTTALPTRLVGTGAHVRPVVLSLKRYASPHNCPSEIGGGITTQP
jgi:hypothetical protein